MARAKNLLVICLVSILSVLAVWAPLGLTAIRQNFDGPYYAVVARSWYNKATIGKLFSFPLPLEYYTAHFPIFPGLMSAISHVWPVSFLTAGLIVNLLAGTLSAAVIYLMVKQNKWGNPLYVSLAWLFLWPRVWTIRSVASPETLFILWTLLSLWSFNLKKYWLAGFLGGLAVLTKSPGILLFVSYSIWFLVQWFKTKKITWQVYPVVLIPLALVGLFWFYFHQTGDFWAYFHSGDNIHLQALPFKIFDSGQSWVGDFWLEDVLWIYLFGGIGSYYLLKKNQVLGIFASVFYTTILFVSHRDISRYALPLAPLVLIGLSQLLERREVRWALILLIIPSYFYTLNFLAHNQVMISDWRPFFP